MAIYGFMSKDELSLLDGRAREIRHLTLKNSIVGVDRESFRLKRPIDIGPLSEVGLIHCGGLLIEQNSSLKKICEKFESLVDRKIGLSRVRNPRLEDPEKIRKGRFSYISSEQLENPHFNLRDHAAVVSVKSPFLVFPELLNIVLNEKILDVAVNYFEAYPILSYLKITRTFANDLPEYDTQNWHFDFGAKNILKVLVYLNNVDSEGGPFSYVLKSHSKKFRGWNLRSRFTDIDVIKYYGERNMHFCMGNVGDVIFAETTGLHKGLKPVENDRSVIIFNFTMHPEVGFPWNKMEVSSESVSRLTPYQKLFLTEEVFHFVNS